MRTAVRTGARQRCRPSADSRTSSIGDKHRYHFPGVKRATVALLWAAVMLVGPQALGQPELPHNSLDCGYQSPEVALQALRDAVDAGEIPDPTKKDLPFVRPRTNLRGAVSGGAVPTVMPDDVFFFEDSASLLTTNFSDGQLFDLMADGTNAVLVEVGDKFDFVAFFLNFVPDHTLGSAFYLGLENSVSGIGAGNFNSRPSFGVAGDNVEGWVMMWNQSSWSPGLGTVTQLVLGQEFEHRFGLFLSPISGGRSLQGNNGSCGRSAHWNFRVDAQGSGMEVPEWVGAPIATRVGGTLNFNTDFGGVFSAPDLYVMGYISPAELDSLPSELRYMDTNTSCTSPYSGVISTWGSADVEASNGIRIPTSENAQKHFRTAWVMIHLPGSPPTEGQVQRVVDMLNDWSAVWESSTLGLGTMDNTLGIPFTIAFPDGTPEFLTPEEPTTFAVQTTSITGDPNPASGLVHFSANESAFLSVPLTFLSGNDYEATLPGFPCSSIVDFYVSLESVEGSLVRLPRTAPTSTPTAIVAASVTTLFTDDFETDKGWTVTDSPGLVDGPWNRGTPVGGGDRGDPPIDFDGSGQCYLTDNVDGNSDVDDGTTTLISPPIDITGVTLAMLQYARWYSNDFGAAPGEDFWVAEITANGIDWVELENTNASTGWVEKLFAIGTLVPVTDQLQVRFSASDLGAGSVVEAGLDAFEVFAITCDPGSCIPVKPPLNESKIVTKNRMLAFVNASPDRQTAIQVTFESLPPPFDALNGQSMWLAQPQSVSQNGASIEHLPGFEDFWAATLQCDPLYLDWTTHGTLHVYHEFIVPGGSYTVRTIDVNCNTNGPSNFSGPLPLTTAKFGDTVEDCSSIPCLPPDGANNIIDVASVIGRFGSVPDSILKPRADLEPSTLDLVINISDALHALNAFAGLEYPFTPSTLEACPARSTRIQP